MYVADQGDAVLVRRSEPLQKANVKTMPYPGFPTDMQPQIAAVLTLAQGTSLINENVWNNRFKYVDELKRLGAQIQVDGKVAIIEGVEQLQGAGHRRSCRPRHHRAQPDSVYRAWLRRSGGQAACRWGRHYRGGRARRCRAEGVPHRLT